MGRHVWLLLHSTRRWDSVGGEGPSSRMDSVPNRHLMKQLLLQLGQMWAPAHDSAAWCLPLL